MKHALWLAILVCGPTVFGEICPATQPRSEAGLVTVEQTWAKALEKRDLVAIDCILADEFQDADFEGKLHDRNDVLDHVQTRGELGNQLSELQAHVYGDFGYVRGLNTVTDARGKITAKVRFTDIFVYRHDFAHWEALAGHETLVKESVPTAR